MSRRPTRRARPEPAEIVRVAPAELRGLMDRALRVRSVSARHRRWVVEGLLETTLRGVDTHGVSLFPIYAAELDGGRARARPRLRWERRASAVAVLDAGDALGAVAAGAASERCVALAREHGVGCVAVRRSNHFGAAACFSLAMARAGCIGLCFSNGDALVAAYGGRGPALGTNPLSFAAPQPDGALCLDMATSQVSYTRVREQLERGGPLPAGWAVDDAGLPVRGPAEPFLLEPLGGYKGQGLGLMVEVLCALLADGPLDHELTHFYNAPFDRGRHISHFFLAIDIAAFVPRGLFQARLAGLLAWLRARPARSDLGVVAPGDLEALSAHERSRMGVPVSTALLGELNGLAAPSAIRSSRRSKR